MHAAKRRRTSAPPPANKNPNNSEACEDIAEGANILSEADLEDYIVVLANDIDTHGLPEELLLFYQHRDHTDKVMGFACGTKLDLDMTTTDSMRSGLVQHVYGCSRCIGTSPSFLCILIYCHG